MVQSISAERTLTLPEYNGQLDGLSWPLIWPAKDPGDTNMDFSLDVSGWLEEIQDTIATVTAEWVPDADIGDLNITSMFAHNSIITIITEEGIAYTTYTVTLTATTTLLGEILSRNIKLPVAPRYGNVIASDGGSVSGIAQ